jgi:hypothetical protein
MHANQLSCFFPKPTCAMSTAAHPCLLASDSLGLIFRFFIKNKIYALRVFGINSFWNEYICSLGIYLIFKDKNIGKDFSEILNKNEIKDYKILSDFNQRYLNQLKIKNIAMFALYLAHSKAIWAYVPVFQTINIGEQDETPIRDTYYQ